MNLHDRILARKSAPAPDGDEPLKLKRHLQNIVHWANAPLKRYGLEAKLAMPSDRDIVKAVNTIEPAFYHGLGEVLHREQVEAGVEVIARLTTTDSWEENVISGTQAGKSDTIGFLNDFSGPLISAVTGHSVQPIIWLPHNVGMEDQNTTKLGCISAISSLVRFEGRFWSTMMSVKEYREEMDNGRCAEVHRLIEEWVCSDQIDFKGHTRLLKAHGEFGGNGGVYAFRRTKGQHELFSLILAACQKENIIPLLVMDESQIAIGRQQVPDRLLGSSGIKFLLGSDEVRLTDLQDSDRSMLRRLRAEQVAGQEAVKSFYEMAGSNDSKQKTAMFVAVSATNLCFALSDYQRGKRPVVLKPGKGYCGFHFIDGYEVCDPKDVVEPRVIPVSRFGQEIGVRELSDLDLRAFNSPRAFLTLQADRDFEALATDHQALTRSRHAQHRDGQSRNNLVRSLERIYGISERWIRRSRMARVLGYQCAAYYFRPDLREKDRKSLIEKYAESDAVKSSYQRYRGDCQRAISKMVEYLLLTHNPQQKKGLLLRWEINNASVEAFVQPLLKSAKFKGKVRFIFYGGMQQATRISVSHLLKLKNPPGPDGETLPYVLIVTGLGRYGETYPPDCGYAYDATTKNFTSASFEQSLLGRMRGFGKYHPDDPMGTRPLVILSDTAYHGTFLPWYEGKGLPAHGKPDRNVTQTEGYYRSSPKYCFVPAHLDPILKPLFIQIKKFIMASGVSRREIQARQDSAPDPESVGSIPAKDNGRDLYSVLSGKVPGGDITWLEYIEGNLGTVNPFKHSPGEKAVLLRLRPIPSPDLDPDTGEDDDRYQEAHTGYPFARYETGRMKYGLRWEKRFRLTQDIEPKAEDSYRAAGNSGAMRRWRPGGNQKLDIRGPLGDSQDFSAVRMYNETENARNFTAQIAYWFPDGQDEPEICQIVLPFAQTPVGGTTTGRLLTLSTTPGSIPNNFSEIQRNNSE